MTSMKTLQRSIRLTGFDFNLAVTLESGQVFGFEKTERGIYQGSVRGVPLDLSESRGGSSIVITARSLSENLISEEAIRSYFDLDFNLTETYRHLDAIPDEKSRHAIHSIRGLRIIRQDPWEALACFIISSNNNVKRIQGIWKNLVRHGSRLSPGTAGFPAAGQIARWHEGALRELGLGYRAPFLLSTARFVAANPVCLDVIRESDYEEAVRRVIAFPGIGPKVADCVLLYGFHKLEAFPVDVWILRVMRQLYFKNRRVSEKKVQLFGQKRWGPNAGYVQQYLFHAARTGLLV